MIYSISLFLHIVGALVLFSAIGIEWFCLVNLKNSEDRETICGWVSHSSILKHLFMIAFFFLLVPGIYMMAAVWHGTAWIIIGLLGLIALSISGRAFSAKKLTAIQTVADKGDESSLAELLLMAKDKHIWISLHIRTAAVLGIVFLMTFKPALAESIIVILIAIVAGFISGKISESPKVPQNAEA